MNTARRPWPAWLAIALAAWAVGLAWISASAADASGAGTVTVEKPASWTGPTKTSVRGTGGLRCKELHYCDEFSLTVDVPDQYWVERPNEGVKISISWSDPSDNFEMEVFNRQGVRVGADGRVYGVEDPDELTRREVFIKPSAADGPYKVLINYDSVVDSGYQGDAAVVEGQGGAPPGQGAVFDDTRPVKFGPATISSAHFLGAEPQLTVERPPSGSTGEASGAERMYVDWPLTHKAQIGQVVRSTDGGDSFRLLLDHNCPQRNRPTCQTGGGGDSDTEFNPYTGNLFFVDQSLVVGNEAVASSQDHGDSFPAARQFTLSNPVTAMDRPWLAAVDPSLASVPGSGARIEALITYLIAPQGPIYVQGIDDRGLPIPQAQGQIPIPARHPGGIAVDNTQGDGRGWIYVPFSLGGTNRVATAHISKYQDPDAWKVERISAGGANSFVWLDLDAEGNAYAVWEDDGAVFYSSSRLADRDPSVSEGRPGATWSPPLRVNLPSLRSAAFPAVTAGDAGRIAITYMGAERLGTERNTEPHRVGSDARWHVYSAVITNALRLQEAPPVVHTGRVSHRVAHTGPIVDGGPLLDFIDIDHDASGAVVVAFMDHHSSFATGPAPDRSSSPLPSVGAPFAHVAKQMSGPSLYAGGGDVNRSAAMGASNDPSGDATWPNVGGATSLEALDLRGAAVRSDGVNLIAEISLKDAFPEGASGALGKYNEALSTDLDAERLRYLLRFSTADRIYHMSLDYDGETWTAGGGELDAGDRIDHAGTVVMAGYEHDFEVSFDRGEGRIVVTAPMDRFGLEEGSQLFSVTAFTMAGPARNEQTLFDPMRTIDATPPFDAVLARTTSTAFTGSTSRTGQYSDKAVFEVLVTDSSGAPVRGGDVTFTLADEDRVRHLSASTGDDGIARVTPVIDDAPGEYLLIARFAGIEGAYEDSTARRDFSIAKEDTVLDLTTTGKGRQRYLRATLSDADAPDTGIPGEPVHFFYDGEHIGVDTTDAHGVAELPIPSNYPKGASHYEGLFRGSDFYHAASGTARRRNFR